MSAPGKLELRPDAVAVPTDDPGSAGGFLMIAELEPVARLGIEAGIVASGTMGDPALDDHVAADLAFTALLSTWTIL